MTGPDFKAAPCPPAATARARRRSRRSGVRLPVLIRAQPFAGYHRTRRDAPAGAAPRTRHRRDPWEVSRMGLFDRVEARLERAVNGVFAKAFRAEVQPVEIASAIRRAMDDRAAVVGQGRSLVPNIFQIELSRTDFDRLTEVRGRRSRTSSSPPRWSTPTASTTSRVAPSPSPSTVDDALETGVFRVRPATAKRPDATVPAGQAPRGAAPPTSTGMPRARPPHRSGRRPGAGLGAAPARPPGAPASAAAGAAQATPRHTPEPTGRPGAEPPGQPRRPALARRRRRALPPHGRPDRPRPGRLGPTSSSTTPASPGATARSG